jgi:tRNA G10  N-methylase Trm11
MNNSLYCLLGNTPQLSLLELETLLPGRISHASAHFAHISPATNEDETVNPQKLLDLTGGTVKMFQELATWQESAISESGLLDWISEYLLEKTEKPTFGIYSQGFGEQLVTERDLKEAIKDKGGSCRYVDSTKIGISSALSLNHPEIFDLMLLKVEDKAVLLQSVATQDIDDWTNRDRNKPYADRKKGMLPPKVARAMVIVGLGKTYFEHQDVSAKDTLLLDPFCGTGTVVMEADLLGFDAIGTDSSAETIENAKNNIEWMKQEYQTSNDITMFTAEAASSMLTERIGQGKIDTLVTEPFLGKPKPNFRDLPNIFKGLEKMYLGSFKRWRSILKNNARVVIIFPKVDTGKRTFSLESLIDKLAKIGYTTASDPVEYAREKAITRRQIMVFTYKQQ